MKKIFILLLLIFALLFSERETFAQTATSSGQAIKDRVLEKIEDVKNSPKAYVGTITDKSQNTLQLKTAKGEIKLISVDLETTTFVKVGTKTAGAKFDDVAIGDFIVAMGFKNGNDILNAKRVLITAAPEVPKRKILNGNITAIASKKVNFESAGVSYELKFPKKWQGPEIKELSEGDKIVVVGEIEGSVLTLRSIFKI